MGLVITHYTGLKVRKMCWRHLLGRVGGRSSILCTYPKEIARSDKRWCHTSTYYLPTLVLAVQGVDSR